MSPLPWVIVVVVVVIATTMNTDWVLSLWPRIGGHCDSYQHPLLYLSLLLWHTNWDDVQIIVSGIALDRYSSYSWMICWNSMLDDNGRFSYADVGCFSSFSTMMMSLRPWQLYDWYSTPNDVFVVTRTSWSSDWDVVLGVAMTILVGWYQS